VARFMPGETLDDAIDAARELKSKNIHTVLTHLGENISDANEAEHVVSHYSHVIEALHSRNLETEISVKLTQLGLDLSPQICEQNLRRLLVAVDPARTLWIDMEASTYVDATITIYRALLAEFPNTGICLQAYLRRTSSDIGSLLPMKPSIRLVKGAYSESAEIAWIKKSDIDSNYFTIAQELLRAQTNGVLRRAAFATHDPKLIRGITDFACAQNIPKRKVEFQMLYGIQRAEQERLANGGWRSGVLIAYGDFWYPWFVRRLAERPANLWLLLRNLASD
jgi:proline dehydrogenase